MKPNTLGMESVSSPERRDIAQCGHVVGLSPLGFCLSVDVDEIEANARLIAAAPDLLAALEAMEKTATDYSPHARNERELGKSLVKAIFAARAAIAKAREGGSNG